MILHLVITLPHSLPHFQLFYSVRYNGSRQNLRFSQNLLSQGLYLIKRKLEINKLKVLENEYSSQKARLT